MNIQELEDVSGQPRRNIRYLIQQGIVPQPNGATRSATYDERHVAALRTYAELKARGIASLDVIRSAIQGAGPKTESTILRPVEGIELRIDADAIGRLDVDSAVEGIRAALADLAAQTSKE